MFHYFLNRCLSFVHFLGLRLMPQCVQRYRCRLWICKCGIHFLFVPLLHRGRAPRLRQINRSLPSRVSQGELEICKLLETFLADVRLFETDKHDNTAGEGRPGLIRAPADPPKFLTSLSQLDYWGCLFLASEWQQLSKAQYMKAKTTFDGSQAVPTQNALGRDTFRPLYVANAST